ncbi:MAG: DMT family transporter [Candidatus Limiplasma sp.]|nr:DMT family transporter [Candidatus Limiplasma sp.]
MQQAAPAPSADRRTGYASLITAVLGTSLAALFYKLSFATGLHPLWVNLLRLCITLVLMAPGTLLRRGQRQALRAAGKRGFWLSALSGTLLAVHFTAWVLALENTDVFAASAIWGTYMLMTAGFSALFLKEKTSAGALVGMVIATIGVVVCNLDGGLGKLGGNLMALLAAALQALYTLCGRKARETLETNTYTSIAYTFTCVWMGVFVWVLRIPATGFAAANLLWALCLAVFCTLLGHTMLNVALKYFKAPLVSAVLLITVVTGPLAVFVVLGDVPTLNTFLGGCIILIGLGWYLWMERRDAAAKAPAAAPAGGSGASR